MYVQSQSLFPHCTDANTEAQRSGVMAFHSPTAGAYCSQGTKPCLASNPPPMLPSHSRSAGMVTWATKDLTLLCKSPCIQRRL
jgi:hypothetical protein